MSSAPIVHKPSIQRLIDDGYEVYIRRDHLLISSVPYVNNKKEICLGTVVCTCTDDKPPDHTVYFAGAEPCFANGVPLPLLIIENTKQALFDEFVVNFKFSNKPTGVEGFPSDYHAKITHYVSLLQAQAKAIDPDADARTGKVIPPFAEDSVFIYSDSASARAGIVAIAQKLQLQRVAIVGLGGTGGYILDQVAKTYVREIHLYDADEFKRHNAFRAPGAASSKTLECRPKKVHYFADQYSAFRKGVYPHPFNIDATNVSELEACEFVFVCVDDGPSRKLISNFLTASGVPFIDVGMGLEKSQEASCLLGLCRITLGTALKNDHVARRLPVEDDRSDALYRSNIQVADINALNAILAVIRWKQLFGFYLDYENAFHMSYSIAGQSLVREEILSESAN